jgi:predicted MFS family arabinose efflux permease
VINQFLDGAANGLFAVVAATWVTDRLADPRRSGEAQVIVGTSLVFGSAIGPAIAAAFVDQIGYRALFACLAGVGVVATAIVVLFVPETLKSLYQDPSGCSSEEHPSFAEIDAPGVSQ